MKPVKQLDIFVDILIAGFRGKELLQPFVLRCSCPFVTEHLVDQLGCVAVCRIVGTDECAFVKPVILLCVMPKQEPDIFVVDLVIIIVIVRCIKRQEFTV